MLPVEHRIDRLSFNARVAVSGAVDGGPDFDMGPVPKGDEPGKGAKPEVVSRLMTMVDRGKGEVRFPSARRKTVGSPWIETARARRGGESWRVVVSVVRGVKRPRWFLLHDAACLCGL